jgi:hypothetical protein
VRIFKTRWTARFTRREQISDRSLREAVERAERGIIDADLGRGLIKQRVARQGQGRSGGYRMIVIYRAKDRAVFLYGFAKSERENIEDDELETMRDTAAEFLAHDDAALNAAVRLGKIEELDHDPEA